MQHRYLWAVFFFPSIFPSNVNLLFLDMGKSDKSLGGQNENNV